MADWFIKKLYQTQTFVVAQKIEAFYKEHQIYKLLENTTHYLERYVQLPRLAQLIYANYTFLEAQEIIMFFEAYPEAGTYLDEHLCSWQDETDSEEDET